MARPTDYKEQYNEQARKLCMLGYTDAELGDFFGVTEQTINNWKKEHPLFFESIKSGKDEADGNVVDSLYKRATGYVAKDLIYATSDGVISDVKEIEKHYPPDPTSIIFWLSNRQRAKWRRKQDGENEELNKYIELLKQVVQPIRKATDSD